MHMYSAIVHLFDQGLLNLSRLGRLHDVGVESEVEPTREPYSSQDLLIR